MIGSETVRRRGSPLAMLALLAVAWVGGRVVLWESPFAQAAFEIPEAATFLAADGSASGSDVEPVGRDRVDFAELFLADPKRSRFQYAAAFGSGLRSSSGVPRGDGQFKSPFPVEPRIAAGHQLLWMAALAHLPMPRAVEQAALKRQGVIELEGQASTNFGRTPFLAPIEANAKAGRTDRWSLDAWAFWREGSNATAITQGRVPIYGASQAGASLRYRLGPGTNSDPVAYARAYRALVDKGETEVAAGIAARPITGLPFRAFAELRYTESAFGDELRPAAFLVTELAPVSIPLGLSTEAYAQAGYVGGDNPTPFADGQLIVSREVAKFDLASTNTARLSVGAGAWGGAQEDAARLDLGPTLRVDLRIGAVPARVSVDWREQVAGDAAPASGLAATVSTRF